MPHAVTPSALDVRRQLDRMLQCPMFVARGRSAELLRFFVDHSIRNGFTPIGQSAVAIDGLGFDPKLSRGRGAEVRVRVGRLREALERYYLGPGRDDRVVFTITQGPYRLVATTNDQALDRHAHDDVRQVRSTRPTLLVVEPDVNEPPGHDGLGREVALYLLGLIAEDTRVNASGPLALDRCRDSAPDSARQRAFDLGYDYVMNTEIRLDDGHWHVRVTIADTANGDVAADVRRGFTPAAAGTGVEEIATWIHHRVGSTFTARD